MEENKEYYSFISYKREDEKWAKWLQDKLEHYKFPTNLNGRTDLPKQIRPTFRDVTDLKPGLLAEEINNALLNSEWLIVVCSPRAAKSPWVCKEAQTFIDLGRADHIIPFVIEGNPFSNDTATECYPDALLNLTGSRELLAANINEMGRDAAVIKVVARMFGLRFDTLWQRHEKEKRRRRNWIIAAVTAFVFTILCIAGYILLLNKQLESEKAEAIKARDIAKQERNRAENEKNRANKEMFRAKLAEDSINQQYGIIVQQRDSIRRSNNELKQSQRAILQSQSIFVSGKAIDTVRGNSYLARKIAIQMLPQKLDTPDRPYTSESELLLRTANKYYSAFFHPRSSSYICAEISPDNKFVIALPDKEKKAYVYDTYSGNIIETILLDSNPSCVSISEDSKLIACGTSSGCVYAWQINRDGHWIQKQYLKVGAGKCSCMSLNRKSDKLAVCINDSIFVWNCDNNSWICTDTLSGHSNKVNSIQFGNPDNQILSASDDNSIRIWEKRGRQWGCIDVIPIRGHVSYADFGYKNKYIATASSYGQINIWEKEGNTWHCKDTIITTNSKGEMYYPYEVHFRPNYTDELISSYWSSSGQVVLFWAKQFIKDGATGQNLKQEINGNQFRYKRVWSVVSSFPGVYSCVRWSHNGNCVVSVNKGVFVNQISPPIPSSKKMKLTDSYTRDSLISQGYSDRSPDGIYYLSVEKKINGPNQICIWNKREEKCIDNLSVWNDKMYTYALFSPDGKKIITGMKDKTVRIWDFPPLQELINETRERFKDNPLTPEERRQYYLE